jgi:hypothetical protein
MPSYIENFECQAKEEDRRAVICQLLKIRYAPGDKVPSNVIDQLAEIPSNEMLRLLLTESWEGLLASLEESSSGVEPQICKKICLESVDQLNGTISRSKEKRRL